MPSLRDMQRAVSAAVRTGCPGAAVNLVQGDAVAAEDRLRIYENNHELTFRGALSATYPVIERLGGSDWFRQRARGFRLTHPSRSGDLQNAGADFAVFLRSELAATEYAYFPDVASLEWAYQEVLIAAERSPLDPQALRDVAADDLERLIFVLRPAVALVDSAYPILAIWRANQPASEAAALDLRLDAGPSRVLLIRRADHVEMRELPVGTYFLARQFLLGATLLQATDRAAGRIADFDLAASLRDLIGLETLTDFHLAPPKETS